MKIAIIISKKDPASLNIASKLDEKKIKYYSIDKKSINCENIDKEIKADLFIFPTKHESKSGINCLSTHSPGNFGKAELGGKNKTLCIAPENYLKKAMIELEKRKIKGFEVIQEVTHHGPYLEKPCMFIEIGSNKEAWSNKKAGKIIADVIGLLLKWKPEKYITAIGIGGLHHTPNFKKIIINTNIALGHICPKYNLKNLNKNMIKQMIKKNINKPNLILLDWKGLGTEKQKIKEILKEFKIEIKRTKGIKN